MTALDHCLVYTVVVFANVFNSQYKACVYINVLYCRFMVYPAECVQRATHNVTHLCLC